VLSRDGCFLNPSDDQSFVSCRRDTAIRLGIAHSLATDFQLVRQVGGIDDPSVAVDLERDFAGRYRSKLLGGFIQQGNLDRLQARGVVSELTTFKHNRLNILEKSWDSTIRRGLAR
jgi:hypothetical protein